MPLNFIIKLISSAIITIVLITILGPVPITNYFDYNPSVIYNIGVIIAEIGVLLFGAILLWRKARYGWILTFLSIWLLGIQNLVIAYLEFCLPVDNGILPPIAPIRNGIAYYTIMGLSIISILLFLLNKRVREIYNITPFEIIICIMIPLIISCIYYNIDVESPDKLLTIL